MFSLSNNFKTFQVYSSFSLSSFIFSSCLISKLFKFTVHEILAFCNSSYKSFQNFSSLQFITKPIHWFCISTYISKLFKFTVHNYWRFQYWYSRWISKLFKFTVHEISLYCLMLYYQISKLFKFTVHRYSLKKWLYIRFISKLFKFTVHVPQTHRNK